MKKRTAWRAIALILALCMLPLPARAEEGTGGTLDIQITLAGGSTANGIELRLRDTVQLAVKNQEGGEVEGSFTVDWTSSDDAVATVVNGLVTAVAAGEATITAKVTKNDDSAEGTATCNVTVTDATVSSVTVTPNSLSLEVNASQTPTAIVAMAPEGATPPAVTWSSDDPDVASVLSEEGKVTGKAAGQTNIRATAGGVEGLCSVTVKGVVLAPASMSLVAGNSGSFSKQMYGLAATTSCLWTSSDESVARVDSNGQVTAVGKGTCTIRVRTDDDKYSDEATVTVVENTVGVINQELTAGQALSFSSIAGEMNTKCRELLGGPLSYITGLTVSSTSQGILYHNYVSADNPGAGVSSQEKFYYSASTGRLALSDVTFVAKSDFSGTAVIAYTGYTAGNQFFTGTVRVAVAETQDVVYSTGVNTPLTFSAADFSAACRAQTGRDAKSVRFTLPASRYGVMYYNYVGSGQLSAAVTQNTDYFVNNNPYLSRVTFVPATDYTGTVRVSYTGKDTAGYNFSGRVTIYISGSAGNAGDINYEVDAGREAEFLVNDFNSLSQRITGRSLDCVRFTLPSSSDGTLYYNYTNSGSYDSQVSASAWYYRNSSPYLSRVSFVPASGSSGTVAIPFTAYDVNGEQFSGTVSIKVGEGGTGLVTYRTARNTALTFSATDFNTACRDAVGDNLNYVRFSLPATSRGTLYYNYTSNNNFGSRVSTSTNYYRDRSSYLSQVTFVPASGYTGTVEISFTGYDVDGDRFNGTVRIAVGSGDGVVSYSTTAGRAVTFAASDFNEACLEELGRNLNYVRFTLPASSRGTLYYDRSSSNGGSAVSASTRYYRNSSAYLSRVSFVPAGSYTGTVSIPFTGYDVNGDTFSGTVEIRVGGAVSSDLSYSILVDDVLTFEAADFNTLCRSVTDNTLNYVRFTLPSSSRGTLYYNYNSSSGTGSSVSASTSYYRSSGSRLLSNVTFVPAQGYTGTVEIAFTAWSTGGEQFTGTVKVTITAPVVKTVRYYSTGSGAVAFQAADFNTVCRDLWGKDLSWVRFTPPSTSVGRLYYGYTRPGEYTAEVRASTSYYRSGTPELGRVSYVPRAGFLGTASIGYTAQDSSGRSYTGTVEVQVSSAAATTAFRDMGSYSWAVNAVDFLNKNGVVSGVSATQFGPGNAIGRGDFLLMLCKAFALDTGSTTSYADVPSTSYYARAIATCKDLGITRGSGGDRFSPDSPVTRQDAMLLLQNAMRAAGWSIPNGAASSLGRYTDGGSVASYAQGAVAAMVELGIISGDDAGRLKPEDSLTRAEMAVILHQALTQ